MKNNTTMKKTVVMIMFAAIVAGSISAQNNNPKREVLFTLGEHEVIVYDEYVLGMALNGYKFAAIVENTQTSKFSLVFNGKRIYETKKDDWYDISYLNPSIENGYAYRYTLAVRRFLNVMGKVATGVPEYGDVAVADNGKLAFGYEENYEKSYANIDGTIFGPYQYVFDVAIADNGKFAFSYQENGKCYANIDSTIFGPYRGIGDVAIADNGKFAFHYYDYENDTRNYNVSGNEASESTYDIAWAEIQGKRSYFHSPNEKIINDIRSKDGKHMFYSDWEYNYVVIDGKEVGEQPAINAYYDEQKHAFVWNAIEGKELVVYEYKL
jgi:hypothetical protein